MSYCTNYKAAQ